MECRFTQTSMGQYPCKKCNQPPVKKVKQIFKTKEGFITYSKLIINEFGRYPTRSNNAHFASNEQSRLFVVSCYTF